jgi:hypothetical protein
MKAGRFASRPLSDLVILCSVYVSCVLYNLNPRSFRFLAIDPTRSRFADLTPSFISVSRISSVSP